MAATGVSLSVMISAYISLIIRLTGLVCKANQQEITGWKSSDVVRFNLKRAYNSLFISPRGLQCKTNL